jgi:hypothetical protein
MTTQNVIANYPTRTDLTATIVTSFFFGFSTAPGLKLTSLSHVSNDFTLVSNVLSEAIFSGLSVIGRDMFVGFNKRMTMLTMSVLTYVGGRVSFVDNALDLVVKFSPFRVFERACAGGVGPEWDDITSCTTISRDREVKDSTSRTIHAPILESTMASLAFVDTAKLLALYLPALRDVRADLEIRNCDDLTSVVLPSLAYVGGFLNIYQNTVITRVELPLLQIVNGYFGIRDNKDLTFLSVPLLTFINRQIYICENDQMFELPSAPHVPTVGLTSQTDKGDDECFFTNQDRECASERCP